MNDCGDSDARGCPHCGEDVPTPDEKFPPDDPFPCPHCGGSIAWEWEWLSDDLGVAVWLERRR